MNYQPTEFMAEGSHYDEDRADYAVSFIECLSHTKGTWAGKPFTLLDWQEQIVRDFDISTPSVYHEVKKLSGGNIQKVLLGREIWLSPRVLITAYPVRGLDIGASYNIYHVLNEQKKKGVAVLFIGEDLDVLKSMDYIFDMGPEGGKRGGMIVAQGTPEQLASNPASVTGPFLREIL